MKWEKLALIRTWLLVLGGLACLCVAAFLWTTIAGLAATGVSALLLAYLTDPTGRDGVAR